MTKKENKQVVPVIDFNTGELVEPPKVYNSLNARYRKRVEWNTTKPHMANPDHTMSIEELLKNHTSGMGAKGILGRYEGETTGINVQTLDLIDLQRLAILNNEQVEDLKGKAIAMVAERKKIHTENLLQEQMEADERIMKKIEEKSKRTNIS